MVLSTSPDFSKTIASYIGTPYEVVNCWELVRHFYRDVFGIELKHYYLDFPQTRKETQGLIYTNKGDFENVGVPKFGDIIVFKIRGVESHIGVFIDRGVFLHSSRGVGCVMDKIEKWEPHISGYYRLRTA